METTSVLKKQPVGVETTSVLKKLPVGVETTCVVKSSLLVGKPPHT